MSDEISTPEEVEASSTDVVNSFNSDTSTLAEQAAQLADRLREAGLNTKRFIDVHNTAKGTRDHTRHEPDNKALSGNYGVYAGGGLIDVDIDDYGAASDTSLNAVNGLPETFTVASPHTDGETGGHRYYKVVTDDSHGVAEAIEDALGVKNPSPSWGEVRVHNQYVVGPGSQISPGGCVHDWCDSCKGCDKEWCTDCERPKGGYYTIAKDVPIAELTLNELLDVLRVDVTDTSEPADSATLTQAGAGEQATNKAAGDGETQGHADITADGMSGPQQSVEQEAQHPTPEEVAAATGCAENYPRGGDRSEHDWAICCTMIEHSVPKLNTERWFNDTLPNSKVVQRDKGIDYGETWTHATREVGADAGTRTVVPFGDSDADDNTNYVSVLRSTAESGESESTEARWRGVLALYQDDETPKAEARDYVVRLLDQQEHFVAVRDTETLWRYVPQTGIYRDDGKQYVGTVIDRRLGAYYSTHERNEIVARLKDRNWTDRDNLGGPEGMVCVANGVLDLTDPATPTLCEYNPQYRFITRLTTEADPTPPTAFDAHKECPEFVAFLNDVVRKEDRAKLQEYAGYCLLAWEQPYKRALVCLGPTDAGKSAFLSIIRDVLGSENVASESVYDLVDTRWGKSSLYGKLANISNELSPSDLKHPQQFKEITSGRDAINAEYKGEDKFEFVPMTKHLFAANQVPSVDHADDAFYNRWLFVTFPTSVPPSEQDHALPNRLIREEASGILNWMLDGYARLANQQGQFSDERALGEKEEMWQAYGDSVDRFVNRCLNVTGDSENYLAKADAHAAYTAMCNDLGLAAEKQGPFTTELKRHKGIDDARPRARNVTVHSMSTTDSRVRCYTGVELTDEGRTYLGTSSKRTST